MDTIIIGIQVLIKNAFQNTFLYGIQKVLFYAIVFSFWDFSTFFGIFRCSLDAGISLSLNANCILEPFVCCVGTAHFASVSF